MSAPARAACRGPYQREPWGGARAVGALPEDVQGFHVCSDKIRVRVEVDRAEGIDGGRALERVEKSPETPVGEVVIEVAPRVAVRVEEERLHLAADAAEEEG